MVLLERTSALDELERWLADARAGQGRLVLVGGEAGVGKTSLLQEFAAGRRRDADRLLWTGCDPLSTPRPLGPLVDIAPALGDRVEALLHASSPAADPDAIIGLPAATRPGPEDDEPCSANSPSRTRTFGPDGLRSA